MVWGNGHGAANAFNLDATVMDGFFRQSIWSGEAVMVTPESSEEDDEDRLRL